MIQSNDSKMLMYQFEMYTSLWCKRKLGFFNRNYFSIFRFMNDRSIIVRGKIKEN